MSRASGCSLRSLGILAWAVRYVNAKWNWGFKGLRRTLVLNAASLKAWLRILGLGFKGFLWKSLSAQLLWYYSCGLLRA